MAMSECDGRATALANARQAGVSVSCRGVTRVVLLWLGVAQATHTRDSRRDSRPPLICIGFASVCGTRGHERGGIAIGYLFQLQTEIQTKRNATADIHSRYDMRIA